MKKNGILFLSVLFLIGNTEFHELLKIPVLVTHFMEHKAQNSGITFQKFISIHYGQKHADDKDKERDNQLPFKAVENTQTSFFTYTHLQVDLSNPLRYTQAGILLYITSFISYNLLPNIWQPPKF